MKPAYLAVAVAGALMASISAAPAQETLKIGVLQGFSGLGSLGGQQTDAAVKLMLNKRGDSPGGKKLEFIRRDTTGPNPDVARRLVQEVVTREKINILLGPDFTPNTLAAAPIVTEAKVPTFVNGAATTGIVGEKSPYMTRTFFATPQLCKVPASYAVKNGWKRVFVMVADFAPGHDCEKFFTQQLAASQGELVGQLRIPINNPEFSGYMQRIRDAKPDALFIFMPIGELAIGSLRAVQDAGLKASGMKVIATGDLSDETYLESLGEPVVGLISSTFYTSLNKTPVNEQFVKDFIAVNGKTPRLGLAAVSGWDAMQLIYDGVEAQKGQKFDPDKFMGFVRGRTFESPRGMVTIDKDNGDIIQDVYLVRTERKDGVLQNVVLESFPKQPFK